MVFFKLGFQLTILLKAKERMNRRLLLNEEVNVLSITKNCGSNTEEERGLHVKKDRETMEKSYSTKKNEGHPTKVALFGRRWQQRGSSLATGNARRHKEWLRSKPS